MKFYISFALIFVVLLSSCVKSISPVETAAADYKRHKNYDSLKVIHEELYVGMHQSDVVRLLGEPDYSPIEGQFYYSTDRYEYSEEQGRKIVVGLVVDYRDGKGKTTEKLREFWVGRIGE